MVCSIELCYSYNHQNQCVVLMNWVFKFAHILVIVQSHPPFVFYTDASDQLCFTYLATYIIAGCVGMVMLCMTVIIIVCGCCCIGVYATEHCNKGNDFTVGVDNASGESNGQVSQTYSCDEKGAAFLMAPPVDSGNKKDT